MKLYRIRELIDNKDIIITDIKHSNGHSLIKTKYKISNETIEEIKIDNINHKTFFNSENKLNEDLIKSYIDSNYGRDSNLLVKHDLNSNSIIIYKEIPVELLGKLVYDDFTVYYEYLGDIQRIYQVEDIDKIDYFEKVSFNSAVRKEVILGPPDINIIDNNVYPPGYIYNMKILKESERIGNIIYPGLIEDNRMFYDAYLGDIYETEFSKFEGAFKRNTGYDRFGGDGYVTIEDGALEMNIYVPKDSHYEIRSNNGNHFNNGTVSKIFIDNVGYYLRTPTDKPFIWYRSILESYNDEKDEFFECEPIYLTKGNHKIVYYYDDKFSTKNNDIDVFIIRETEPKEYKKKNKINLFNEDNKFNIGSRIIFPFTDFYIDNDKHNPGTGSYSENTEINNKIFNINDVNSLSKRFSIFTGTMKNRIKLDKSDFYDFSILCRWKDTNKDNNKEILKIEINNAVHYAKKYEEHNGLVIFKLFNRLSNYYDEFLEKIYLEKENNVSITVKDDNNIIFDSLILNTEIFKPKSDIIKSANLFPNFNEYYFIYDDYNNINSSGILKHSDFYHSGRFFNANESYKDETIQFEIRKSPLYNALNNFDMYTKKINYTVLYKNKLQNLELEADIESHYLLKLLMINDTMEFDRFMIFKPFILQALSYKSEETYEEYISKFNEYDSTLIPFQSYANEKINDVIYDLGEDWKDKLMNKVESMDDITFTMIYNKIYN